ncbi:MAG: hypothetical protein AUJ49_00435 [Desulfovibrionaceae bacterium CG1_02_65_16]|nr:MAG: hypothetical protein AUJ49_00435 [Desulfovibrionaceae bacterium CG1_02_65_16]
MSSMSGQLSQILLPFAPGCRAARFVRREKRFTAIAIDPATGEQLRAHTNNTGSMLGLLRAGAPALLSPAKNPDRALKWTLEALGLPNDLPNGAPNAAPDWVGVNTLTPNRLLAAAWRAGLLPEARAYARLTPEFKTGHSRLDARFDADVDADAAADLPPLYVECKNVTLVEDDQAQFPDAASERGRKHLDELIRLRGEGCRAALFFLVQRPDGHCFAPAEVVDPAYAEGLARALAAGVEAWVWRAAVAADGIRLAERLPLARPWATFAERA